MLPEAETIGILYTTSEANSESAIKEYEALAEEYDFTIETAGITATADIPLAAQGDVYKRQPLIQTARFLFLQKLPEWKTVSYTHLDVYKRQRYTLPV